MDITPYSPIILDATKSSVSFTVQMNPNNLNNPFRPVRLFYERSPCDIGHTEMHTWIEVSGLAFFMTNEGGFKITWTSEEITAIDVSCKDRKFWTATPTDEERETIFKSQHDSKYVRITDVRKNYVARPSALNLMVLTEFGTIYRPYKKN